MITRSPAQSLSKALGIDTARLARIIKNLNLVLITREEHHELLDAETRANHLKAELKRHVNAEMQKMAGELHQDSP